MRDHPRIEIGLNAAIVSMRDGHPVILHTAGDHNDKEALPYGGFNPLKHRTMEEGLRRLVEEQTGLLAGYVEQLYTFGDRGRMVSADDTSPHVISVGYLALSRQIEETDMIAKPNNAAWRNWYEYFPWENWWKERPILLDEIILPTLLDWAHSADAKSHIVRGLDTISRVKISFGLDGAAWTDNMVLDRYELMYSAGLVDEAMADGRTQVTTSEVQLGKPMLHDHRRILATAIDRLRGKLKYRPVIFELMPDRFTLLELQKTVESIFGRAIHKGNFRRLVENAELVEPTGESQSATGGRPAALFRFRADILKERPAPGLKVGLG